MTNIYRRRKYKDVLVMIEVVVGQRDIKKHNLNAISIFFLFDIEQASTQ